MNPSDMTHAELESLLFVESTLISRQLMAFDRETLDQARGEPAKRRPLFEPFVGIHLDTVAPGLVNLLHSAPLLYQQLTKVHTVLDVFMNAAEEQGITPRNNPAINMLAELQKSVLLMQQVAREGVMKVSADIDREAKNNLQNR